MTHRDKLKSAKRIVIKVGSSSLSFPNGRMNFFRMEKITRVVAHITNSGKEVLLVSSGALAVGAGRMGHDRRPDSLAKEQALAAVGQAELMRLYQKFFDEYDYIVAQILLTRDGIDDPKRRKNAVNTLNALLEDHVIPIINENDTVATEEIEFGDNDTLSAKVATMMNADLLIVLSNIDGLYDGDPADQEKVKVISEVTDIDKISDCAGSSSSSFSTGGMVTKIEAARWCCSHGIDMAIVNGSDPASILKLLDGKEIGTLFVSSEVELTS